MPKSIAQLISTNSHPPTYHSADLKTSLSLATPVHPPVDGIACFLESVVVCATNYPTTNDQNVDPEASTKDAMSVDGPKDGIGRGVGF